MQKNRLDDHRDERGYVVNPFCHIPDTGTISNCHVFSIEPNCTRGNHTHPGRNEEVLVLAGRINIETPKATFTASSDTTEIITLPKNTKHIFKNESDKTAIVICWSSKLDTDYVGDDTIWK